MYPILRPLLFKLPPEVAHDMSMNSLALIAKRPNLISKTRQFYADKVPELPVNVMGLSFNHPVGLAAGLDKNARAFKAFSALGFSGVEMGTVTPLPQAGNTKPRMFRLLKERSIINRMGFNSDGLDSFLENIDTDDSAVAGINIGKNKLTPNERAIDDYVNAMENVYKHAKYITINISSPNTESLRDLQAKEPLNDLLHAVKEKQTTLQRLHSRYVPIALKIAPDLNAEEIKVISNLVIKHQFDALIATNTTVARPSTLESEHKEEVGGLSGASLKHASTNVIASFYQHLKGQVPIIGVGGIETTEDAWQKLLSGADYLQIYSGLIYHGPDMIQEIVNGLKQKIEQLGFTDLATAMQAIRQ